MFYGNNSHHHGIKSKYRSKVARPLKLIFKMWFLKFLEVYLILLVRNPTVYSQWYSHRYQILEYYECCAVFYQHVGLVKCCGILKHVWNGAPDHWIFSILFANTTHNRFYLVIPSLLDLDSLEMEFLEANFHYDIQYRAMFHLNSVLSLAIHGYFQLSGDDVNAVFCRSTNNFVKRTLRKPFSKSLLQI